MMSSKLATVLNILLIICLLRWSHNNWTFLSEIHVHASSVALMLSNWNNTGPSLHSCVCVYCVSLCGRNRESWMKTIEIMMINGALGSSMFLPAHQLLQNKLFANLSLGIKCACLGSRYSFCIQVVICTQLYYMQVCTPIHTEISNQSPELKN